MYIFSYKDCKDYKDCKTGTHVGGVERNKNTLNRLDFTHFFPMSNLIGRKTLPTNYLELTVSSRVKPTLFTF